MMKSPTEPPAVAPVDDQAAATPEPHDAPDSPPDGEPKVDDEPVPTAPPRQRGLWGMMGQAPAKPDVETASAESSARQTTAAANSPADATSGVRSSPSTLASRPDDSRPDASETRSPAPRGLFALMQRTDDIDTDIPGDHEATEVRSSSNDDDSDLDEIELDEDLEPEPDESLEHPVPPLAALISPGDLEPPRYRRAAALAHQRAWLCFGCGSSALVASSLTLFPNYFASLPATALGFIALIAGYLALTGDGRREVTGVMRGIPLLGMLLGTVGIFAGPLFLANLGRSLREATGPQLTRQHLQQMGEALERHYVEHEAYPIGGTFARNDAGEIQGQHGWMTFLLPYIGEAELYRAIDQTKPFDDLVNRNAMGRNVTVYFAAGGDRARIGNGFAVAHFAGLGGEIDDANGLSHLGIFERDVAVKREEITDGLSETLIVGELAGTYPPWGDPENWRQIGRGLNKDVNGFGSYTGNGATFLRADGSVKFFSNKTDPKLLERMSTRDGTEQK
jgi:hypothetical protein